MRVPPPFELVVGDVVNVWVGDVLSCSTTHNGPDCSLSIRLRDELGSAIHDARREQVPVEDGTDLSPFLLARLAGDATEEEQDDGLAPRFFSEAWVGIARPTSTTCGVDPLTSSRQMWPLNAALKFFHAS